MKSYSAESGFVYQYAYDGQRGVKSGTEFVFSFSADRKAWHTAQVVVVEAGVRAWESSHGRTLSATERYALAKMALFAAFDERAPGRMSETVFVREADVAGIVERLGLDE